MKKIGWAIGILILLASCQAVPESEPTATPANTKVPATATNTIEPTSTLIPVTATAIATETPINFEFSVNFEAYEKQFPLNELTDGGYLLRCVIDTNNFKHLSKVVNNIEMRSKTECFYKKLDGTVAFIDNVMMYGLNKQKAIHMFALAGGTDQMSGNAGFSGEGLDHIEENILEIVTGSNNPGQLIIGIVFGGNSQNKEMFDFMLPITRSANKKSLKSFSETGNSEVLNKGIVFPYDAVLTDTIPRK